MQPMSRTAAFFAAVAAAVVWSFPVSASEGPTGGEPAPSTNSSSDPEAVPVLVIEQRTSGLPSNDPEEKAEEGRQLIVVDHGGRKLLMRDFRIDAKSGQAVLQRTVLLRLDHEPPRIYSIAPDGSCFIEHPGDLNDLQVKRRIQERNFLEQVKRLSAAERKQFFIENPRLRPDGRREATQSMLQGETHLELECERLVVKENDLTIIDAQITRELPGARSYYHLYRRLGVFSEEVLDVLKEIEGVPLRSRITVVTALPIWTLEAEILSYREEMLSPRAFELPPDAKACPSDDVPANCPQCAKVIEDPASAVLYIRRGGTRVHLCSEECADRYADELLKQRSKKPRGRPQSGKPTGKK